MYLGRMKYVCSETTSFTFLVTSKWLISSNSYVFIWALALSPGFCKDKKRPGTISLNNTWTRTFFGSNLLIFSGARLRPTLNSRGGLIILDVLGEEMIAGGSSWRFTRYTARTVVQMGVNNRNCVHRRIRRKTGTTGELIHQPSPAWCPPDK